MRDIVCLPVHERPEYAYLCLRYLSKAKGVYDKDIWICQDHHVGNSFDELEESMRPVVQYARRLFGDLRCRFVASREHDTYGNSTNILNALREAVDARSDRVFLLEDDIIVAPDVFDWHEEILKDANPFVSCATALNRSAHFQINGARVMDETLQDPSAYLKVFGPYSSHCAAFRHEKLIQLLDNFNEHPAWEQGKEQDICIQQILLKGLHDSAWPYVPRAYNVGWRSYHINTGVQFNGTLEEKVAALESVIHDPARLHDMSAGNQAVTALPAEWPVRTGPVRNVQRFR